jgi:glucans biosynthesis protein
MSEYPSRRDVFQGLAASAAALAWARDASAAPGLAFDPPKPFSWDLLRADARAKASAPYVPPKRLPVDITYPISYEALGLIHFRPDHALFADGPGPFPLTFFHIGRYSPTPVEISVVENGASRKIRYDQGDFDMPADSPARRLPEDAGFAGFKIQEARGGALDWRHNDWVAFLGASYFRAIGELGQYGISARGIALDVAVAGRAEEFPAFTQFYVDSAETADTVTLYALMEGPSIAGAYRFLLKRGKGVIMDIAANLYMRAEVSRLGIAPLTSMYWFSETKKPMGVDWRPEVHDSDGLAMWTGSGERLWRPLNDPPRIMVSSFTDENPRGFGLCQRDRVFDHYLDGVNYDKRPTLWVEPSPGAGWGKGSVQLCEIPTGDEYEDNIVAMWVPERPVPAGGEVALNYRLYWLADEPFPTDLARCVATRLGLGDPPVPRAARKFVVEFLGGALTTVPSGVTPEWRVTLSRGALIGVIRVEAVPDGVIGHWRVNFDAMIEGAEPVELRGTLTLGGAAISEVWLFQYHPF